MRILLVDDDTGVIPALLAIIKTLPGHELRVATTGAKALENAATLGGVDLLITDVVMQPMDGFALRDHLVSLYPAMRTILITGYDLSDYPEQTQNHQLLAKPIDAKELLAAIAKETVAPPKPEPEPKPILTPVAPLDPEVSLATVKLIPTVGVPVASTAQAAPPKTANRPQPAAVAGLTSQATVRVANTEKLRAVPAPSAPRANSQSVESPGSGAPASNSAAPPPMVRTVRASVVPPGMPAARPVRPGSAVKADTATPKATPRSAFLAPPIAAAPDDPAPAEPTDPGELAGQSLGAYQLRQKIGDGRWGSIYAAVQISINRPVGIEILDADKAIDDTTRERFIADARAKAQVQHPSILAVYEAGEAEGRFFYAHEFVDGGNLAVLKAGGQRLDEPAAVKTLRVASEGLAYLTTHHIPHQPPDAASIALGSDGQPHLTNVATHTADEQFSPEQEIQALGRILLSVLPAVQSLSQGLRDLLKGMVQTGPEALTSWGQVLQGIKAIEPKVIPVEAAKISAQDRAAIAAVELARKQQKRALYFSIGSVVSLLLLVGALFYWLYATNERNLDEQVDIPAGEFLFANGEPKTLPEFWIDKYEVTYGQYAKFVKFLEGHPTTEFDDLAHHQPPMKNTDMHKPPHWDIYYPNAITGKAVHGVKIDLNCPVMEVDYWDAYAYAKWKGRELPTEEEWEKAARGLKGLTYPWGENFDPKKVNSGVDYDPQHPDAKGSVDGYNFWNPVDKIKGDLSPFGVIGMAGNVHEWTSTWDPVKKRPIVRGGSFMSKDVRLDQRFDTDPSKIDESIGFRTVSHAAPPAKK